MTRSVIVQPEAEADLREAHAWCEGHRAGLGVHSAQAAAELMRRAAASPFRFPAVSAHVRRARIPGFPYNVLFVERDDVIFVIGVFHHARDSRLARGRIERFDGDEQ